MQRRQRTQRRKDAEKDAESAEEAEDAESAEKAEDAEKSLSLRIFLGEAEAAEKAESAEMCPGFLGGLCFSLRVGVPCVTMTRILWMRSLRRDGAMSPQEPLGPHVLDFVSHSAAQTHRLGVRLGRLLKPGDVLLFSGEFGAGKTTFIQGLAEGLGIQGPVTSPSFTLIWEHQADEEHGCLRFYHVDLYRVRSVDEALGLGLEDCFYGSGVCAVEWAERLADAAPAEHLRVHLAFLSDTKRIVRMEPVGPRYVELLDEFKREAFGR